MYYIKIVIQDDRGEVQEEFTIDVRYGFNDASNVADIAARAYKKADENNSR